MSDTPAPVETTGHTILTRGEDGLLHVQTAGPWHVVEEHQRTVTLAPGETLVVQHVEAVG